jgi:hypothetical protein
MARAARLYHESSARPRRLLEDESQWAVVAEVLSGNDLAAGSHIAAGDPRFEVLANEDVVVLVTVLTRATVCLQLPRVEHL